MADPQKISAVLELIESGESERKACETVGISRSSFRSAALKFMAGDQYARALEALARDQIEKAEATIEDMRNGTIDAQMARVELDFRKWTASKLFPKQYGDKIETVHSGAVDITQITRRVVDPNGTGD